MTVWAIVAVSLLLLAVFCMGLFGALIQIATTGLEAEEHEPVVPAPHRPVWR